MRVVAVTAAGRRKVAEADEVVARVQRDVLAALPEDRREALLEGLADLLGGPLATPAACARPCAGGDEARRPAGPAQAL